MVTSSTDRHGTFFGVCVAGLLLTGGSSRRLGTSKALLRLDGQRFVDRTARALESVCDYVLEVGPGYGAWASAREEPPGSGPLAALAAGGAALEAADRRGMAIVLAVDLPFIDESVLRWLARHPGAASVVPRVAGIPQPLCARYTPEALEMAATLVARGERAVRSLLDVTPVHYADADEWGVVADARAFADIDTRDDAERAGVELPAS
jgi:molybdopterin-guanine dinucleotide biosynthesis protein A